MGVLQIPEQIPVRSARALTHHSSGLREKPHRPLNSNVIYAMNKKPNQNLSKPVLKFSQFREVATHANP